MHTPRLFRFAAALLGLLPLAAGAANRLYIGTDRLLDVETGKYIEKPIVVIEGERIVDVRSGDVSGLPTDGDMIQRHGTLLPGLIDCHVHLGGDPTASSGNFYKDVLQRSAIDDAVTAHVYVERTLAAGFTTVRNLGSAAYIDVALRNAITRGTMPGPRILAATLPLGATGGHADDTTGFSPWIEFHGFSGVADGVDAVRKQVREDVKHGADVIKFMASAGVLSAEESVGAPQYSQVEMDAIVDEAHRWGRKVAAHAHGAEAIKMAIRAGVDSVEHASLIDDEGLRLAKQRGTFLVMDIFNDDYILAEYTRLGFPESMVEKEKKVGRLQRESFPRAVKSGVRLAFGTDAGVYPHGDNARQFAKMVEWGQTPLQAIRAATVDAAELIGWKDRVGKIKPGYYADLIIVDGDPLTDVTTLEHVRFVLKGGKAFALPAK